jgi:5,10-methylenetetrahydromethanopterin reductase
MRFGVSFNGDQRPNVLRDLAQSADEAGVGTLWVASHLFQREPIVSAALVLANTPRLTTSLMAMSPLVVHPVHITMAAATLDEWYPGRVILCFGVGAPRDLAAIGMDASKPLQAMSESIAIARALLSGEVVRWNGERYHAEGRRLSSGRRDIPIMVAASGPEMLELAGAEADGVLISAATSPAFIAWALGRVAAGEAKSMRRVHKAALVFGAVAEDGRTARDGLRRRLAGTPLDQAALARAFAAEDWLAVNRLVHDQVVQNHTASGTPEQVIAAMQTYAAVGLDEIVLAGVSNGEELRLLLQAAALSATQGIRCADV